MHSSIFQIWMRITTLIYTHHLDLSTIKTQKALEIFLKEQGFHNLVSCFQFCMKSGIIPQKLLSFILLHCAIKWFSLGKVYIYDLKERQMNRGDIYALKRGKHIKKEDTTNSHKSVRFLNLAKAISKFPVKLLEEGIQQLEHWSNEPPKSFRNVLTVKRKFNNYRIPKWRNEMSHKVCNLIKSWSLKGQCQGIGLLQGTCLKGGKNQNEK